MPMKYAAQHAQRAVSALVSEGALKERLRAAHCLLSYVPRHELPEELKREFDRIYSIFSLELSDNRIELMTLADSVVSFYGRLEHEAGRGGEGLLAESGS